jgi:hypothetical protein
VQPPPQSLGVTPPPPPPPPATRLSATSSQVFAHGGKGAQKGGKSHWDKGFAPWAAGPGGKGGSFYDAWGGMYVDGGYVDFAGTFWPCARQCIIMFHGDAQHMLVHHEAHYLLIICRCMYMVNRKQIEYDIIGRSVGE